MKMRHAGVLAVGMLAVWGALAALPLAARGAGEPRQEYRLANGVQVRLVPAHEDAEVAILMGVPAGILKEPQGKPHVAHIAEHVLTFGGRPGSREAEAMSRWFSEGRANAETLDHFMYFDLHLPPGELAAGLRVQAARLSDPAITAETLQREIPRALAEVENLERREGGFTGKFAYSAFAQAAFFGQTEIALKAESRRLRVADVRGFWERTFAPDRAVLYVVGNFSPAEARREIEAAFGAIGMRQNAKRPARPDPKPGRVPATWDVAARHLLLAWSVPPASHADHPALTLASRILMQRLFADSYISAHANLPIVSNEADRLFLINMAVKPDADMVELESKVLGQVAQLAGRGGLGVFELTQHRMGLAQELGPINIDQMQLPPNMSKNMVRTNIELQRMSKELAWGDLGRYASRVQRVDARSFQAAASRHLARERAIVVRLEPKRGQ